MGAVVAASLLALVLSACTDESAAVDETAARGQGTAAEPNEGTPSSGDQWDTIYKTARAHIAFDAASTFGAHHAEAGTNQAVALTKEMAFSQQLLVAKRPEGKQTVLDVTRHMTPSCAKDWSHTVDMFVDGSDKQRVDAAKDVYPLTFYDAFDGGKVKGKPLNINREGPAAVNPEIKSVQTSLDSLGRLAVEVKSSADLRVTLGDAPRAMHLDRKITYWLVETAHGWKVDGFQGNYQAGQLRPESAART
jgi:hypothetical protein